MAIPTIIYGILAIMLGLVVGAMWGLSLHKELLDWLEPPVKKSLEEQLWEKNIGVIYREELTPFGEIIMKICLDYADRIKEAATEEYGFLFRALEDRIRDELLHRSGHQFDSNPVVKITWNRMVKLDAPDHKYIQVEFNLEKYNASEL